MRASMLALMLIGLAHSSGAEGLLKLYGGAAFTGDSDTEFATGGFEVEGEVDYGTSATGGLRLGYWLQSAPFLGFAADFSYFLASESASETVASNGVFLGSVDTNFDLHVIPITPMLMLRTPVLGSGDVGVQPYVAAGPGIFVSVLDWESDVLLPGGSAPVEVDIDGFSADLGLDARAGINLHLRRWLVLFTEYRFTYFEPEQEDDLGFGLALDVDVKAELATHHVVAGVGFLF